jgi:hypothetical protein
MMCISIAIEDHMNELNSKDALRMFAVLADAIDRKRDRKSVSERVMEMVAELHEQGFALVKVGEPMPNAIAERERERTEELADV